MSSQQQQSLLIRSSVFRPVPEEQKQQKEHFLKQIAILLADSIQSETRCLKNKNV